MSTPQADSETVKEGRNEGAVGMATKEEEEEGEEGARRLLLYDHKGRQQESARYTHKDLTTPATRTPGDHASKNKRTNSGYALSCVCTV